eukprot:2662178-Rhodomonas_salina.5
MREAKFGECAGRKAIRPRCGTEAAELSVGQYQTARRQVAPYAMRVPDIAKGGGDVPLWLGQACRTIH